jgi:two-component system sensor histidine kinase DesK
LTVADDGRGGDDPEGSGLRGMRERLAAFGGSLERDGSGGTRLQIVLPRNA